MLEPLHMVTTNLTTLLLLIIGLLIYKFIYPKRKVRFSVIILMLSSILSISIFRQGGYESGDFNIHLYRTISFFTSLNEGILLPSWAGQLNQTYGYPLFIFNYPLPYYLISFFHLLGFGYVISMKLFLTLNIFGSGLIMYWTMRQHFKNDLAAFTATVFYLFVPYHLIDVHFKVVIGEILFFTLLPLALYFLDKLVKKKVESILYFGIVFFLLVLSHVVIALFAAILFTSISIMFYFEDKRNGRRIIYSTIFALCIGGIMSLYIWTTPFLMSKYTIYQQILTPTVYSVELKELIFSPYRYGLLFQGPKGEIANIIGYSQLLVVFGLIFVLFKRGVKSKIKSRLIFWLGSFFILTFLITPYADIIWREIPLLRNVGNQRILILVAFVTSILAGYLPIIFPKKQKIIYIFLLVTVLSTSLNWGQRRVIPTTDDSYLLKNLPQSTVNGEAHFYANSKWVNKDKMWFLNPPLNNLIIKRGNGEIKELSRNSTIHRYVVYAKSPLILQESTLYFPGWIVKINNKVVPISYETDALINFLAPNGLSLIEVSYSDIPQYKTVKIISIIGIILVILQLLLTQIKKRYRFKRT